MILLQLEPSNTTGIKGRTAHRQHVSELSRLRPPSSTSKRTRFEGSTGNQSELLERLLLLFIREELAGKGL